MIPVKRMLLLRPIIPSVRTVLTRTLETDVSTRKQFYKLKRIQKAFQKTDGVPIYLKGGFKDKVLYNITLLTLIGGVILSVQTVIQLMLK